MRPQISTESETEPSAFRKLFGCDDDIEGDGDYVSHRFGFYDMVSIHYTYILKFFSMAKPTRR